MNILARLFLTVLLVICICTPIALAEIISEEPVTEESFVMKEESQSDIIIKELPATLTITPFLSNGLKLSAPVDIKELPTDKAVTSEITSVRSGVTKTKIVQIYPESVLEVSNDVETIKQTSTSTISPKLELYYGYQRSSVEPWQYYYKIEKCDTEKCTVVRAEFDTKRVWIEEISVSEANTITGIPAYEALP